MRPIDAALLRDIAQGGRPEIVEGAAPALAAGCGEAGLTTPLRLAHFLAQIAYESDYFTRTTENLDYSSALAIIHAFPKLDPSRAASLVHAPEALANAAYGPSKELGNRGEASGDGWRYRGRGLVEISGRWNYMFFGGRILMDLLSVPSRAADPATAARIALAYWEHRGCNAAADADDCAAVTRAINGGIEGIEERARLKRRALALLTADAAAVA